MAGDERTVATKPVMLAAGNDASAEGPPFHKAALVVNTRSRSGETAFDVAAQLLPQLGVPLAVTHALAEPRRLPKVVGGALRAGCDLIVVGGGDGSIGCVVDLLAHHDAALGVLPVGTANDFARTLGIPFEIKQACETVASGALVDVDLGQVGSDYYVNVASVGVSAAVARSLASGLKRWLGMLAYPTATARALVRHRPFSARLTFPDVDYEPVELQKVLQLSVGNGRFYGGGCVVSPGSGIDDRMLDVYAIEAGPYRELFRVLRRLRGGAHMQSHLVSHFQTRSIHVETLPAMPINVDGEILTSTPATFSLAPNALRVLVARTSSAARLDRSERDS